MTHSEEDHLTQLGESFLAHYGVKGMKWGVRSDNSLGGSRKNDHPDVSRKTNKEAATDAQEFARAKMFYGQGAGTRRKLIKAKVEAKSAKDPNYKKAFDHHLAQQDLGRHAEKARTERKRKDATETTVKTSRGVYRSLTNGFGSVPMASAVIAAAIVAAKRNGADKIIADAFKQTVSDTEAARRRRNATSFLRDSGLNNL